VLHRARLAGTVSCVAHAHADGTRLRWRPPRRGPIYIRAVIVGSQWHLGGGRRPRPVASRDHAHAPPRLSAAPPGCDCAATSVPALVVYASAVAAVSNYPRDYAVCSCDAVAHGGGGGTACELRGGRTHQPVPAKRAEVSGSGATTRGGGRRAAAVAQEAAAALASASPGGGRSGESE
jgi:hypothetical protein